MFYKVLVAEDESIRQQRMTKPTSGSHMNLFQTVDYYLRLIRRIYITARTEALLVV